MHSSGLTQSLNENAPSLEASEALPWLLETLSPQHCLLLIGIGSSSAVLWANETRLNEGIREALTESIHYTIVPLTKSLWGVRLIRREAQEDPSMDLGLHTLCRSLVRRLDSAFRRDLSALNQEAGIGIETEVGLFTVTPVSSLTAAQELDGHIAELNDLLDMIANQELTCQFQPIVDLRDGYTYGYEALIRSPKGRLVRRFGQMFEAADRASMVAWFDIACQEQCFVQAAKLGLKRSLFVNMDAAGLAYLDLHDRSLAARAHDLGLSPSRIVIEITERQAIEDFPRLIQYMNRLRADGFKIAIDDAGAGYNSLYTISEMRPDFIKIDRAMVRNIDVNGERRALLAALLQYARRIGTAVLAEGAETEGELATLIDLGIPYGQGYLMGRPQDDFRGVTKNLREFIEKRAELRKTLQSGQVYTISELARPGLTMSEDTLLDLAVRRFSRDPSLTSIVVTLNERPLGLLMRSRVQSLLDVVRETKSYDEVPEKPISEWIETNALNVHGTTPINEVARQAMTRKDISLDTDILVTETDGRYRGVVPARMLLEAATGVQENRRRYADSLTGMPGRVALEQIARERLGENGSLAFVRFDIEGLESFNRRFGVIYGDDAIQATARLLRETAIEIGQPQDFLSHLGGDNFVVLTVPERSRAFVEAMKTKFEQIKSQFFSGEQIRQGFFDLEEPGGGIRKVPLISLCFATSDNRTRRFGKYPQVMSELDALLLPATRGQVTRKAA